MRVSLLFFGGAKANEIALGAAIVFNFSCILKKARSMRSAALLTLEDKNTFRKVTTTTTRM
jgi:hypothetical protein